MQNKALYIHITSMIENTDQNRTMELYNVPCTKLE